MGPVGGTQTLVIGETSIGNEEVDRPKSLECKIKQLVHLLRIGQVTDKGYNFIYSGECAFLELFGILVCRNNLAVEFYQLV